MKKNEDKENKKIEILNEIKSKSDVIINLLTILTKKTLNADEIKEAITKNRTYKDKIIKSFNSCDGKTILSKIAKACEVNSGNLSRDIDLWERSGFVVKIEKKGKVYPKALIYLE